MINLQKWNVPKGWAWEKINFESVEVSKKKKVLIAQSCQLKSQLNAFVKIA